MKTLEDQILEWLSSGSEADIHWLNRVSRLSPRFIEFYQSSRTYITNEVTFVVKQGQTLKYISVVAVDCVSVEATEPDHAKLIRIHSPYVENQEISFDGSVMSFEHLSDNRTVSVCLQHFDRILFVKSEGEFHTDPGTLLSYIKYDKMFFDTEIWRQLIIRMTRKLNIKPCHVLTFRPMTISEKLKNPRLWFRDFSLRKIIGVSKQRADEFLALQTR